ncbi:BTB/POZ domain-containing protein 17-like [Liolophura sinensis]|uniref:BTB/POZ domain-containing protein 17-like n=1 Tax=Liolophura sinensis TaxID=3198878 RepID=UPI00315936DE
MAIGRVDRFDLSPKSLCKPRGDVDDSEVGEIDNSDVTLKKLTGLLCTSELSDLELLVGHKVFHVHKLILCMSSEVLRVMLTNPKWPEFYKDRILLKEEPECVAVFDKFLKYLYSGLVELSPESALPLLMLADKYGVTEMSQLCIEYMCAKCIPAIRKGHIVSWLRYAHLCAHQDLEKICQDMILWNFKLVTVASDFVTMHKETLMDFLKSSDIVIHDEYVLYCAVKKWLLSQKVTCNMSMPCFQKLILETLCYIRFPFLSLPQLKVLHLDELAQVAKQFFEEKITLGIKYHSQPADARVVFESSSRKTEHYFPRSYTSEMWNTVLVMENYSCLYQHVMRLMYFSSPVSGSIADDNIQWEWQMELYPKGVHFGQFMMIGLQENHMAPEAVYNMVRLSIKAETPERKHVEMSVLVAACEGGMEYVRHVVKRRFVFDQDSAVCNFDHLIPYTELNSDPDTSMFMTGEDKNAFKVMIIIKPLVVR